MTTTTSTYALIVKYILEANKQAGRLPTAWVLKPTVCNLALQDQTMPAWGKAIFAYGDRFQGVVWKAIVDGEFKVKRAPDGVRIMLKLVKVD